MSCEPSRACADGQAISSALALTMRPLRPLLANPKVMRSSCIQPAPGSLRRVAQQVAAARAAIRRFRMVQPTRKARGQLDWHGNASTRRRRSCRPPCRPASCCMQVVLPPATSPECVAIAIRRPADAVWSIDELQQRGIFRRARRAVDTLDDTDQALLRLLALGDYAAFVRARRSRLARTSSCPAPRGPAKPHGPRRSFARYRRMNG